VTCFNKKDETRSVPKFLWYPGFRDLGLLQKPCPEDTPDPIPPDGESDEDGGQDKQVGTYFHVEIF
jgi:hypothetical protein